MDKDLEKEQTTSGKKYRKEVILPTLCLILVFFLLGAGFSIMGPTLVHLRYLYQASITQMTFTLTFFAGGYLLGSILCGTVFDRFNREIQFFITCMSIGLLLIVSPWIPNLYGFFIFILFSATAMGYLDSTGQPYTITLWEGHKLKGPIVQLLYSIWTIGNFAGPFAVGPFLVELPKKETEIENNGTTLCANEMSNSTMTYSLGNTTGGCAGDNSTTSVTVPGIERVRYPFLIVGLAMSVSSFSFLVVYFCTRKASKQAELKKKQEQTSEKETEDDEVTGSERFYRFIFLSMMFFFCIFLISAVGVLSGLLSAFVLEGLKWSVEKGPLISSTFMGAQAVVRIIAIPVSFFIKPVFILGFNVFTSTLATLLMIFVEKTGSWLMWLATALVGMGLGTTFPSAMLWTSSFMKMTGRIGSVFFIGGSIGIMGGTALGGYLFDNYSHMWVVYLSFMACCLDLVLFIGMLLFAPFYRRKVKKLVIEVNANGKEMTPLKSPE